MKTCIKCQQTKDDAEFPIRNRASMKRNNKCRECHREYVKIHYEKNKSGYIKRAKNHTDQQRELNRKNLFEFLQGKKCADCGNTDFRVLEFDHDNRKDKRMGVCKMVCRGHAWNSILKEIEKCTVRCANCHRIKTTEQLGWSKTRFIVI